MKTLITIALLLFGIAASAQSFYFPIWDDDVQFKSVKLKFEDKATNKVVFDGYKDATISIRQVVSANGRNADLYLSGKISGYLQFNDAHVVSIRLEQKVSSVSYMMIASHEGGLLLVSVAYDDFNEAKPKNILVMYEPPKKKAQTFILTGFE